MEWFHVYRRKFLLGGGYLVLAILLDLLSGAFVLQTGLAICYPPAGLYLAAILLLGWAALPLAFLNPVFSVLITLHSPDIPLAAVLGIGIVSMISPAISLAVLKRTSPEGIRLHTLREVVTFIVVVALALILESLAAASVYVLTGLSPMHSFGAVTVDWWISNSIPYFTLTPVILLWYQNPPNIRSLLNRRTVIQTIWIAAFVPLAVWVSLFTNGEPSISRLYVVFLPIVWAALIGGITGAAWISLCVTASVLVLAPALLPNPEAIVEAQFSLLIAILTGLMTGVVVTERRQAEADLLSNEKQYRNIIDNAIDGIFQSIPAGRFIRVNPSMARMYGYDSPEDMLESITDISTQVYVNVDDRTELRSRLANGEKLIGFETLDYRKDGSTFWTSMNVQAIRDTDGDILFYEGTIEDITSRKAAIENQKERQHFIETILDTEPGTVYIYDLQEGKNVFINRDWLINYGYSTEETQETENLLSKIIHPDDLSLIAAHHNRIKETEDDKSIFEVEYRVRRKNGEWRWVQSRDTVFIRDVTGQVVQLLGILHDVTESKKSRNALIESEKKYRQLFENMTSGFAVHKMIYDEHGKPVDYLYLEINPAFEKLTGVPANVLLGKTLKGIMPDTEEYWIEKFGEVASTGRPLAYTNFSRELGKYYDTYAFSPEMGTFAVVFNDVTEKIKAQEEVQKLNEELNERVRELESKNAELTQFAYTVSHDLKSPLVTINGYLGFIEQDAASGNLERLKKDIQRIHDATSKMHALLTELLELSRIGRMMNTPETFPFEDLIKDALDIVHGQLETHQVTVHSQPNLPAVYGDRQRLTEVLQNLLDNAAKYMGDQSDPHIEIGQQGEENDKPIFFVKDNGIGIAPEYHERIFGLFNKLDPTAEGTGIGLALVKRIIEVHG
ncbi:MAG: PAS domain S-box protein, partial [Chloroflexota bacterium]